MAFYLKELSSGLFPEASRHAYEEDTVPAPDVISILQKFVDQVAFLARRNTNMWEGASLNLEAYSQNYSNDLFASSQFATREVSRVLTAHLPVTRQDLVDNLMDPKLIEKIFPSLIAYASYRSSDSEYLVMDVGYMPDISPLLQPREKCVVRCKKRLPFSNTWVVAEFSMRPRSTSPPPDFIKLPSGFVIEDKDSGCEVKIVEHWLLRNGSTLAANDGAHRLLTSLQRHYLSDYNPRLPRQEPGKYRTVHYNTRVANLSTQMVRLFCAGITGVAGKEWITPSGWYKDEASDETVLVLKKKIRREWDVKNVVRTVTIDATPSTVSSLLHDSSNIWQHMHGYTIGDQQVRLLRGDTHPTESIKKNYVSVYEIKCPGSSDGFLIEETYFEDPKMIIRAVLDAPTYESVVKDDKVDPLTVKMLPFGVVIHPASANEERCTLSVCYQFETDKVNVDEAKTVISQTLSNLTNALPRA